MLTNKHIKDFAIRAVDGEIGTVADIYFDDETWAIRYLVVETGGWLDGRRVLISPISVARTDWAEKQLDVALTKRQIENSPTIDTHKPVSRQHEAAFLGYYGYPYYWDGPYLWGPAFYPAGLADPARVSAGAIANRSRRESQDSHLRSTEAVTGSRVEAADGEIGHVDGFIVDDEAWAIRYIEVATRNWLPGKKVLISPAWIERVVWADAKVYTGLSREVIKDGPEYIESRPITREYESRLHSHYGRPPYWPRNRTSICSFPEQRMSQSKAIMKICSTVIVRATLLTALLASSAFARDHSAMNGVWTLAPTRSDFAGQSVVQSGTVTISDRQGIIIVSRNFVYEGAAETFFYKDITDAENNATIHTGKDIKSRTRWDHDVLKVTTTQSGAITRESYTLAGDGSMVVNVESPEHRPITLVFQRK